MKISAHLVLFSLALGSGLAQRESLEKRIARVENGLMPAIHIAGISEEKWSLTDRMAHYEIPGVSLAVINEGVIEWTRSYGVVRVGDPEPVTAGTLFPAASISKPITAVAALTLVDAGMLELDTDVNSQLKSWKLPISPLTEGQPVTLRRLLSHTAGITTTGGKGYTSGEPLPTLAQILDGLPPASSLPVRVDYKPGSKWAYSGAGYSVVQRLLVDATGLPFSDLATQRVLAPAGMTASRFAQPLPSELVGRAASGHLADGYMIPEGAKIYPDLAADGLWTTPSDLARFALAVSAIFQGRSNLLSLSTAEAMVAQQPNSNWGLGVHVEGSGDSLKIAHGGSVAGFKSILMFYPRTGHGVAIMTNSANGNKLNEEILRALSREYGWPHFKVLEK